MMAAMRHTLPITFTLLLVAASAFAQSSGPSATATANAPVYIAPDASRTPLRTASVGTVFTVVAEEGDWTKVQFKDPQWGVRVGYVETRLLRISRPELAPMDLSVTSPASPPATVPTHATAPARPGLRPWEVPEPRSHWPASYIVGRGGVTFGTRTAPLAGFEIGGHVAPMLQVYGTFDWHRDISPEFIGDLSEIVSDLTGLDVNYRFPAYVGVGGVKVIATRGMVRPYGLGGFGFGRVRGTVEVEGEDVTELLDDLGYLDRDDIEFNKPLFEVGGGVAISNGSIYVDVGYRFRKFLDTGEPINVSGIYAGVGVGF
jgi:opacity protein-like surface antigen